MGLWGAIGGAIGRAISSITNRNKGGSSSGSSGGRGSSWTPTPTSTYTEGGITYENRGGQIYKNGKLVPKENYKYIPSAIGGSRDGASTWTPSSGGGGSSPSTPSYSKYITDFGGAQKYADAIKSKGIGNLTDPVAAQAFMKDNPQYFYNNPNNAPQAGGQGGGGGTDLFGSIVEWASNLWNSGQVSNMEMQLQQQQLAQMQAMYEQSQLALQQAREDAMRMGDQGMREWQQGLNQMSAMLQEMEAQLTQNLQGQMTEQDPMLQAAIGLLRQEVDRQRQEMMEEMNARGLTQSGIMLEMSDRVNQGELTQVRSLVGSRIADLQGQLNNALMQIAGIRANAMQQFQGYRQDLLNNQANIIANLNAQALQNSNQWAGIYNDYYTNVANRMQNWAQLGLQQNQYNQQQQRWQSEFDYQQQRDQVRDQQWQQEFDWTKAYQQQALATRGSSGGGYSSGRSTGGGKSNNNYESILWAFNNGQLTSDEVNEIATQYVIGGELTPQEADQLIANTRSSGRGNTPSLQDYMQGRNAGIINSVLNSPSSGGSAKDSGPVLLSPGVYLAPGAQRLLNNLKTGQPLYNLDNQKYGQALPYINKAKEYLSGIFN